MTERLAKATAVAPADRCVECGADSSGPLCSHCGAASAPGGLRTVKVLSKRPYGRTYLCEDANGAKVAVKEVCLSLVPEVAQIEALDAEAEILKQLSHPCIPQFIRAFREGDGRATRLYLVSSYVPGRTLDQAQKSRRFSEHEARLLARGLLEVLEYIHGLSPKLLHLDLRPENIVLRDDGKVSLIGFGAAGDLIAQERKRAGVSLLPPYAPEELRRGEPSEATDLFLLGATLVQVLSRRSPEELLPESGAPKLKGSVNVSPEFLGFLEALVAPHASHRPPSARAALELLKAIMPAPPRPIRRRRFLFPVALLCTALSAFALGRATAPSRVITIERPTPAVATTVWRPAAPVVPVVRDIQSEEEGLRLGSVRGKYRKLLRKISVPQDLSRYPQGYVDYGRYTGSSWAGYSNLPPGYWVYVHPNWYIFEQQVDARPLAPRAWGPEQATGAPDTLRAGDIMTAWASHSPDQQAEWLRLDYAKPVNVRRVAVYETYNPGALNRVTATTEDGREVTLWEGTDPTTPGSGKGVSQLEVKDPVLTQSITLHLDSPRVMGWNEIDAVSLEDAQGEVHWATGAHASSTYADK